MPDTNVKPDTAPDRKAELLKQLRQRGPLRPKPMRPEPKPSKEDEDEHRDDQVDRPAPVLGAY